MRGNNEHCFLVMNKQLLSRENYKYMDHKSERRLEKKIKNRKQTADRYPDTCFFLNSKTNSGKITTHKM